MKAVIIFLFISFLFNCVFCDCGKRVENFIGRTGLQFARKNESPWTVSLVKEENGAFEHFCGAVILNERWLITTAQCVTDKKIKALVGEINLENITKSSLIIGIDSAHKHEKFDSLTYENDIAILRTSAPIPINGNNINSICLPAKNMEFSGTAYASGWGSVEQFGDVNYKLKVIQFEIFNDSYCESAYKNKFFKDTMFCGRGEGKGDACNGDSGGPAVKIIDDTAYLVGLISFGNGCYREKYPGVYTEVSYYIDWIQEITGIKPSIIPSTVGKKLSVEEFEKDCGIRENTNAGRIVGGRPAGKKEYPWTVALEELKYDEYVHFCGASVISDRWIVTAAHCLHRKNINKLRGVFGATDLDDKNDVFITSFIKSMVHEAFNYSSFENDIALLKTKDRIPSFTESKSINRICLPKPSESFLGRVYVSGWGRIEEDDETTNILKVLAINLYDDSDCEALYEKRFKPKLMLCAGFLSGKRDSCEGDSGGPLEKDVNGKRVLIGIVSFGEGCARKFYPGVYAEVSRYVPWIHDTIISDSDEKILLTSGEDNIGLQNKIDKHKFTIINNCSYKVWISILGKTNSVNKGSEMISNSRKTLYFKKKWTGRIWGKTGCEEGACITGNYCNPQRGCQSSSISMIHASLDIRSGEDWYGIIYENGFNLPVSIKPVKYTHNTSINNCKPIVCNKDINLKCPPNLSVTRDGRTYSCKSACLTNDFCCGNEHQVCKSDQVTNYEITFCPL